MDQSTDPRTTQPAPLSPEQLAAISARAEAATPGPWCTDDWEIYRGTEYVAGAEWIGETCRGVSDVAGLERDRADAAFVAAARTDVPALLAEVDRLRARIAELERPEIERQRGEIQQSYRELAAHARADRDFESEAIVLQRLADREAEWAAEDAAARRALGGGEPRG